MKKNIITNKITPCCGLPFSVVYWWVENLTLNSPSDRSFILSKISQNGTIAIDGWKVLINSGTLEADASLTKADFLAWFDCGNQPTCEQLKLIIEGYKMGRWVGDLNEIRFENVLGVLKITDTAPTTVGLYRLSEVGTYTNLGGLVTTAGKINDAYFNGTTWSLIAADLPQPINNNYTIENTYIIDPEQIVPSEALYNDTSETLAGDIIKRVDINTGENVNYRKISNLPELAPEAIYFTKDDNYYERIYDNYINIEWFKTAKDGVTDDADKFQEAFDFLASVGGGKLFIPKGTYAISHVDFLGKKYSNITIEGHEAKIITLHPTSRIIREGNPQPTLARNNSADGCFFFNAQVSNQTDDSESIKNITISGITFISDVVSLGFDELSHQISAHGVSNFRVENCKFIGFLSDGIAINRGDGIYGSAYNKNFECVNCYFDGINKDNRNPISIYYCDGYVVDRCVIKNSTRSDMPGGIDTEADSVDNISRNGSITNCSFDNIGGLGAVVIIQNTFNPNSISFTNYTISNCSINNCSAPLFVGGHNPNYLNAKPSDFVIFEKNTVQNCDKLGEGYNSAGVLFRNNYFLNIPNGEITSGCNRMRFIDNKFRNIGNEEGIVFFNENKDIDFIGNTFTGMQRIFTMNVGKSIGKIIDNDFGSGNGAILFSLGSITDASEIPRFEFSGNRSSNFVVPTIYDFMTQGNVTEDSVLPKHIVDNVEYEANVSFSGFNYQSTFFSQKKGGNILQFAVNVERTFVRFATSPTTWSTFIDVSTGETKFLKKAGTTAERPTANWFRTGTQYFDTTLNKPIYADNANNVWRDSTGAIV